MAEQEACILGIGMMTSVGLGAAQTAASVRAGISRFGETSISSRRSAPLVMALLPDEALPQLKPAIENRSGLSARQRRMLRLAAPALREAGGECSGLAEIPLFLGAPEGLPDMPEAAGQEFLECLAAQSEVSLALDNSRVFAQGRAAGLVALAEALQYLSSGAAYYALVGGVDTYLEPGLLGALDAQGRILTEGVMDGFIPGEGAGFVLLGADKAAKGRGLPVLARIRGAGLGHEKGHLLSEEPYRGDGLAEAFQQLLGSEGAATGEGLIKTVMAGFNGESFWAKEWGVAYLRNHDRFTDPFRIEHPADCFGDPGAALGPLLIGLAAIGLKRGYLEPTCCVWCSSDREERGATLVTRA